tara:strand:+ start:592 stop:1110 length:519 start_codon:yes stop_codon:yes gene_type:complete
MFFKALPKIKYPVPTSDGKIKGKIVTDIFRRVQLDKFFSNRQTLVDIIVDDNDTPESVAYNYYGSTQYHWIVLLSNNIVDVDREWPLSYRKLNAYVKDKYGENNSQDVHHYVDATRQDIIVDWDAGKLASGEIKEVTNFEYENDLNDKKRQILLLNKRFLKDIVTQYKKLVK